MYESFFGLTELPFGMTPDPLFYYRSASHREALAALQYGVRLRRGLMTLVGDVGTGKTILAHALLGDLDPSTCGILIAHTTVSFEELLRIALYKTWSTCASRLPAAGDGDIASFTTSRLARLDRIDLINELNAFVVGEAEANRPPPLWIIDEAQNLSVSVLKEIRLLTNLEGPRDKLLQLVLVGQLGLREKLLRADLRLLRQRVAVSAHLGPLSRLEAEQYIRFRLQQAGAGDEEIFTTDAVDSIWAAAHGSPRSVNVICDYCMVNAFAAGSRTVHKGLTLEAIRDVVHLSADEPSVDDPPPEPLESSDEEAESGDQCASREAGRTR